MDQTVDITLLEVDQEYIIPSYLESYAKRRIAVDLNKTDQQQELFTDLMIEQKGGVTNGISTNENYSSGNRILSA